MTTAVTSREAGGKITQAQKRALFAAGKRRGMDIDELRALTPQGSISSLSRAEANRLLDSLNRGTEHARPRRARRRPKGVYAMATPAQHRKIEALRLDLGWTPEKLQEWLSERHHNDGRPMTSIDSSADGIAVIELLKAVLSRSVDRSDATTSRIQESEGGEVPTALEA